MGRNMGWEGVKNWPKNHIPYNEADEAATIGTSWEKVYVCDFRIELPIEFYTFLITTKVFQSVLNFE